MSDKSYQDNKPAPGGWYSQAVKSRSYSCLDVLQPIPDREASGAGQHGGQTEQVMKT